MAQDGDRSTRIVRTIKSPLPAHLREFARDLRQELTTAEALLWELLRDRRLFGLKFRRQHPAPPFVVDFYCDAVKLGIELDGGQHNSPEGRRHDERRTAALARQGIAVVRFWNNEVLEDTEGVLNGIWRAVFERGGAVPSPYGVVEGPLDSGPHPRPLSQGERGGEVC
jgi:very-short-patch-repair endonuclease